ncbi:MAG: valine--tRNA ligase [Nanoarchaeota archaeon]
MKIYDPLSDEPKILDFWEKEKIYEFKPGKLKTYSIDTPPPTVSGDMHIGHAFSYSQQDFIARFRRMYDGMIFYPFGTDDNGLPTERLIERLNNVKSKEMPRSEFIELCLKTLKKITPGFIQQWKNIGISADYEIYYSTIDKNSQKISQESFLNLYKAGRVYKLGFPSIWCPECQTAIAQAELEDREFFSFFTTLKFFVGNEILPISTTRPELIPACVAIFVHPSDKKYKKFVGKKAKVPLFNYEVPIFADKSADMEKGTGAMMICSYGDKFDVDALKRLKLEPRIVINYDGTMKEERYKGLKIKEAKAKILQDLKSKGLIINSEKISHVVNVHDKCGTEIEFLPTDQWFIKILDKKKEFLEYGKRIKWHPEYMSKRYENWVNGLQWDWIVSRDRHFGVPIPVWQCIECNKIILPDKKELPVDPMNLKKICPKCKKVAEPETRVLDTWATSSLTPRLASSLIKNKIKIPYSLRPQAHDIIRTWVFYTIVKSYFSEHKIPWENIMLSGFVTLEGKKMSKSKGIVINPKEVMEKYGVDAVRFWAAGSKLGEDLDYSEKDVLEGKKFITKLWNASNFVFMNLKDFDGKKPTELEKADIEFLGKLNNIIKSVTDYFLVYEYSKAKQEIEKFFWKDFCDNYLETIKKVVYQGDKDEQQSVNYTLYKSLLTILKLFAPITPFITEYIYQEYFRKYERDKSIHISKWPELGNEKIKGFWDMIKEYLSKIKKYKSENKMPLNAPLKSITLPDKDYKMILDYNYGKRFEATSGAVTFESGKEFKIKN